ncbi:zinc finger CCCH domain-containing protein 13 [Onthophagus taurus]|uniref:zinc finger CCCH domain-containing protein 13 n=1 Tax=Onthophagus taurus TaxID=166361 RepID=UPI0039BDA4A1
MSFSNIGAFSLYQTFFGDDDDGAPTANVRNKFLNTVPREPLRVTSVDREPHPNASAVRKEKLPTSKEELIKEASKVLQRADRVGCVVQNSGHNPEKYYTLPARRKNRPEYNQSSLERKSKRRNSDEIVIPPKKPPRTFASTRTKSPQRTSIFNLFKKSEVPAPPPKKKSNLRRSVSDASALKSKSNDVQTTKKRAEGESKDISNLKSTPKKQLSPIIEVTPREDYFQSIDKEIIDDNVKKDVGHPKSVTEQLQEYIDEVDEDLYKETGIRISPPKEKDKSPRPVIIDVDEADQVSKKKTKSFGSKLRSLTKRGEKKKDKNKENHKIKEVTRSVSVKTDRKTKAAELPLVRTKSLEDIPIDFKEVPSISPNIQKVIDNFENKNKEDMIHSSQKPVDKLPLTRGRTVDNMVKRLSRKSTSPPPPKTNITITPSGSVQHNNNQPFSYTRGLSPDKNDSPTSPKPIIYAQVVCNNKTIPNKQTVHTYVNGKKNIPHSDSDEGLGYEENTGFSRKYDEKPTTRFGDHDFYKKPKDYFIEEEFITPKFKSVGYNGFSSYENNYDNKFKTTEQSYFTERGRGDGMDAKRRESLTEQEDVTKFNGNRNDLSARRDILESRINRRFGEKSYRISPEYSPKTNKNNVNNVYITETNSKYYRSGSASPVGYKETYTSETMIDRKGEKHKTESRNRQYFGEPERITYKDRFKEDYRYNSFENEPKSFDSQISDYRSSPENNRYFETSQNYRSTHKDKYLKTNQHIRKDRNVYKSNPEIHHRSYDNYKYDDGYQETYHDSLKREKHDNRTSSKYRNERYFDQNDNERKDKFGDSGIENDFRRDSGDNFKLPRSDKKREPSNESEDEGFASSLLIASERQHTEDNFARRRREARDSKEKDDHFRNLESMEYNKYKKYEYSPRERSIDDGSHYDPRLDKEFDRGTLKKIQKKPPKPEKKSGLEKVKQLFSRDTKKKKEKEKNMVSEENLRSRYTEYRGSREELEPKIKRKEMNEIHTSYTNYANRRRLSTPSPTHEPIPPPRVEKRTENTNGGWFKSLDRLSRKKSKKSDKDSSSDEMPAKSTPTKNLRFFGDTDIESNDSLRKKPSLKARTGLSASKDRLRSQSTRDLHNISEEIVTTPEMRRHNHKSMLNISESDRELKGSRMSLKPPMSPSHNRHREGSRSREERMRRRKNEVSSVESSTEGDSSQQSQRSVVYLHAPTVGDIPGPGYLRNGRRAASREELTSNSSSRIQPQVKTLSRSFSVLAPWRPKHYKETLDIDYTQYPKPVKNGKYEQRVMKNGSSRKETSSTLKKKAQETKRTNQNTSTLNRRSKSKENISTLKRGQEEPPRGSNSTLYKKRERPARENNRYSSNRDDRKMSSKSMSVESLGGTSKSSKKSRDDNREVSRSISMPRDPEKSAGWFNMKKKKSGSTQRL